MTSPPFDPPPVVSAEEFRAAGFSADAANYPRPRFAYVALLAWNGVSEDHNPPPAWRYAPNQWVLDDWNAMVEFALRWQPADGEPADLWLRRERPNRVWRRGDRTDESLMATYRRVFDAVRAEAVRLQLEAN